MENVRRLTRRDFLKDAAKSAAVVAVSGVLPPIIGCGSDVAYDTLIRGGEVHDGMGNAPRIADIGIIGDRIVAIGNLTGGGARTIEAQGLLVCPGFIDVHTHVDITLLYLEPIDVFPIDLTGNFNYMYQGVTTVVAGNCGAGYPDIEVFFDKLDASGGYGTNICSLAPHGLIRDELFGDKQPDPGLNPDQLELMKAAIADQMEKGTIGFSVGLEYANGCFSNTEELIEIAKVVKSYDGLYATHTRDQTGRLGEDGVAAVLTSIDEAIQIGQSADIPVQVSHLQVVKPWEDDFAANQILDRIETARQGGLDITGDIHVSDIGISNLNYRLPIEIKSLWGVKKEYQTPEGRKTVQAEIERWRELLARNIALRNPNLSQREVNFSVQRTIDRIIFLRICEDRGVENYGRLMALQNGERVYKRLFQIFREADDRYNSGLFYFRAEKGRPNDIDALTPDLTVDDKVLKDILKNLYYPDSPYEFSVLPSDILGQVYEQFLGKVIRLTPAHRAVIEFKPEVRKAGGVYYTPTYIVDYIVKETVGKLVEGKKPGPRGGVTKLKILDPACGSGSFLLGAYQYLLDWHRDEYVKDDPVKWVKGKNPCLYQKSGDDWRLTTDERKRILLNNIYGVDIDHQAVEVTKLSLLLKVLEGEDEETIQRQLSLFQQRALPDLGNNIKCGNSLIGPDFYTGKQMSFVDDEEMYRVNAFDWEAEFPEIMDKGGFDSLIGNPPYIRIQRIAHSIADYLFHAYKTANSKTDLSLFFLERALSLVTKSGLVGFICTSQWLSTDYGKKMRKMLSDGQLHEIVDFGSLPVFHKADTYPAIFISSPSKVDTLRLKRIQRSDQLNLQAIEDVQVSSIELDSISEPPWNLGRLDIPAVLKQREVHWKPLQAFGKAYIGLLTGMDKAFVISREVAEQLELEGSLILPYAYRGAEVRRYTQVQPDARVIYPYREGSNGSPKLISEAELRQSYPKIYQHLLSYRNALRTRKDSRKFYAEGANWFRHLRPGSFNYIHPTKFIIKGIDIRTTIGLLEENTAFNGANCPGIIVEDSQYHSPLYILGILNSNAISYYLRMVCPAKLGGYTRFNARNINNTPIRVIDFSNSSDNANHNRIVALVEKILDLNQQLAKSKMSQEKNVLQRQIEATDRQIDKLVYKLYDLTDEEIEIVEGLG